jgi:hypothetical protein
MSEPTVTEPAIVPEVTRDLTAEERGLFTELRDFTSAEADKVRSALPQLVEQATAYIHDMGAALLAHHSGVIGWIEDRLNVGTTAAAPAQAPAVAPVAPADVLPVPDPLVPAEPAAAPEAAAEPEPQAPTAS